MKLRFDMSQGKVAEPTGHATSPQLDDAEAQMRRALGLDGGMPRMRPESERSEPQLRPADRFTPNHRRRFVQDGDIPVTVVRRDPISDAVNRPAANGPSSSRLQRAETALATETAARERAERQLSEAQAQIRDLQTKFGHAELARAEAVDVLRREREAAASQRAERAESEEQLQDAKRRAAEAEQNLATLRATLQEERAARQAAEKALREAEELQRTSEKLIEELTASANAPTAPVPRSSRRSTVTSLKPATTRSSARARTAAPVQAEEPEPVKWWLTPKTAAKRR